MNGEAPAQHNAASGGSEIIVSASNKTLCLFSDHCTFCLVTSGTVNLMHLASVL